MAIDELTLNNEDLTLIITNDCNLDCIMCPQHRENESINDIMASNLSQIRDLNLSLNHICITGGEPTLYWDKFIEIIRNIHKYRGGTALQVLTNGARFKDLDKVHEITQYLNENSLICIPIYSDIDKLHNQITGHDGSFWNAIQGIRHLSQNDIPIEIRIVLMKPNISRLPEIIEFIWNFFPYITHLALMGLEPMHKAQQHLDSLLLDRDTQNQGLIKAYEKLNQTDIDFSIYNIPLCHLDKSLWQFSRKSISEWKRDYPNCEYCSVKEDCGGIFHSYLSMGGLYNVYPL